jgi:malate dehydrogenase (oxaloacetate-decarboxylating)
VYDSHGPLHPERGGLTELKHWLATHTEPPGPGAPLGRALAGADVFIGVSGPGTLDEDDVAGMAGDAVVFALANPDPEIDPETDRGGAARSGRRHRGGGRRWHARRGAHRALGLRRAARAVSG